MVPTSFLGQLIKLAKLLCSSPVYLGLFIIFGLLFVLSFLNIKRDNKIIKSAIVIIFLSLMLFAILGYHQSILLGLDYLFTAFAMNLYFPSFAIYVLIVLFSYLVFIFTIYQDKFSTVIKKINLLFFCLIQFLFSTFLILVITNKIDISSRIEMYKSADLTIVLQISMILFLFWALILVLVHYWKLIRKYFISSNSKKE